MYKFKLYIYYGLNLEKRRAFRSSETFCIESLLCFNGGLPPCFSGGLFSTFINGPCILEAVKVWEI